MPQRAAIRQACGVTEGQSNKLYLFAALDDIAERRLPAVRWGHPALASLLNIDPTYAQMVQHYLVYRRSLGGNTLSRRARIGIHGARSARITTVVDNRVLDVLTLDPPTVTEPKAVERQRLTQLYRLAIHSKVTAHPNHTAATEEAVGLICGMPWGDMVEAFARQRSSARRPSTAQGVPA